jgi:hypothetical protein
LQCSKVSWHSVLFAVFRAMIVFNTRTHNI